MNFNHLNIKIPQVAKQVTEDGSKRRLYRTTEGNIYPSITTILGPLKREVLEAWRARVGDDVADEESRWGKDRGSALHLALEELIKNKSIKDHPMLIQMLVDDLMPFIHRIGNIHCQETVLYSDYFKTAGRVDLIAYYNGKLSIIDFKGSKRPKRIEWIEDYFIQTSFYAYAYFERTKKPVEQCVILMANEQTGAQEFIVEPWKWWDQLKNIRNEYV